VAYRERKQLFPVRTRLGRTFINLLGGRKQKNAHRDTQTLPVSLHTAQKDREEEASDFIFIDT